MVQSAYGHYSMTGLSAETGGLYFRPKEVGQSFNHFSSFFHLFVFSFLVFFYPNFSIFCRFREFVSGHFGSITLTNKHFIACSILFTHFIVLSSFLFSFLTVFVSLSFHILVLSPSVSLSLSYVCVGASQCVFVRVCVFVWLFVSIFVCVCWCEVLRVGVYVCVCVFVWVWNYPGVRNCFYCAPPMLSILSFPLPFCPFFFQIIFLLLFSFGSF